MSLVYTHSRRYTLEPRMAARSSNQSGADLSYLKDCQLSTFESHALLAREMVGDQAYIEIYSTFEIQANYWFLHNGTWALLQSITWSTLSCPQFVGVPYVSFGGFQCNKTLVSIIKHKK